MEKLKLYLPNVEKCPNISFTMRVLSFLICLILGFVLTTFSIVQLAYPRAHYRTFSLWYSLSNLILLISTFILLGPKENYSILLSDVFYNKSVVLTGSILFGFIFGILTSNKTINLFFDFVQFFALIVFSFTYISTLKNKNINASEDEFNNENNNNNINDNYLMNST